MFIVYTYEKSTGDCICSMPSKDFMELMSRETRRNLFLDDYIKLYEKAYPQNKIELELKKRKTKCNQ